jgi:F0F1-type ATP synthase assembly protein I
MIINPAFFDIFGIVVFLILLIMGLKFSKYKDKQVKYGGYFLIVVGLLGLVVDLYNVLNEYIIPLTIR